MILLVEQVEALQQQIESLQQDVESSQTAQQQIADQLKEAIGDKGVLQSQLDSVASLTAQAGRREALRHTRRPASVCACCVLPSNWKLQPHPVLCLSILCPTCLQIDCDVCCKKHVSDPHKMEPLMLMHVQELCKACCI